MSVAKCPKCGQVMQGGTCLYCAVFANVSDEAPPEEPTKAPPKKTSGIEAPARADARPNRLGLRSLGQNSGRAKLKEEDLSTNDRGLRGSKMRGGAPVNERPLGPERKTSAPKGGGYQDDGFAEPRMLGPGAKARFTKQADERGHYLIVPGREPVELPLNKHYILGRDPRTSLQIVAPEVSRQHCEIEWKNDRPLIAEVRSQNGTFLNGKKVERDAPQPLRDGDEIRLGLTFKILYRNVPERDLKKSLTNVGGEATLQVEVGAFRPPSGRMPAPEPEPESEPVAENPHAESDGGGAYLNVAGGAADTEEVGIAEDAESAVEREYEAETARRGGRPAPRPVVDQDGLPPFEADFAAYPPKAVLEGLYERRASGVLVIRCGADLGSLVVQEGKAKHVSFGTLTGPKAVSKILSLKSGSYKFQPTVEEEPEEEHSAALADMLGDVTEEAPAEEPEGGATIQFGGVLAPPAARPTPRPTGREPSSGVPTRRQTMPPEPVSEGGGTMDFGSVLPLPGRKKTGPIPIPPPPPEEEPPVEGGGTMNFDGVLPIPPKPAKPGLGSLGRTKPPPKPT